MGGTCVNTGCMPTWTLVASVKAAWLAREGEWLGILTGRLTVDAAGVHAGKDAVEGTARSNLTRWMKNTAGTTDKPHGSFSTWVPRPRYRRCQSSRLFPV